MDRRNIAYFQLLIFPQYEFAGFNKKEQYNKNNKNKNNFVIRYGGMFHAVDLLPTLLSVLGAQVIKYPDEWWRGGGRDFFVFLLTD